MHRILTIGVLVATAAAMAAGCRGFSSPPRQGVTLRPTLPATGASSVPMFNVRVVVVKHRVRPDAPVEDIWRLLGTTNVPYEKRALWEANDLRLGDGAHLAADRLNDLAAETSDRTARVNTLQILENMDLAVAAGGERDLLEVLWTDAVGRASGREFVKALPQFRLVCRTDPQDAEAVRVALVPEVLYGPEELRWVRTDTGAVQRMMRASCVLSDLAAEVRLAPGRILVIGGRHTSDLSPGGVLFLERRGPDAWIQTVVLTVERVRPGEVPEGGKVPFMPPAKAPTPAKAATPGKAPAAQPASPKNAPSKLGG
jgi:hypothetical protein